MSVTLVTFAVDDTSPFVSYAPFGDTFSTPNLIAGWNPYFTFSGFASAQGAVGNGTSQHITSLDGASLALQWSGTGITLMGNATQSTYSITLDEQLLSDPRGRPADNVLADIQGLTDTHHTVRLTAHMPQTQNPPNSSMLVFDQAMLFSSPIPVADNIGFQNQTVDDQQIAFLGKWSVAEATTPGAPEFHSTTNAGDRAVANFSGTTLILLGATGPSGGNYSVSLDNSTSTTLSAHASFAQTDALLYFATDLDPATTHSMVVQNLQEGAELSILVGGVKAVVPFPIPPTTPPPTTSPSPSTLAATSSPTSFSEGTIAAFALAGILAFILISGTLYFFLVFRPRRRRRRQRRSRESRFYDVAATRKYGFDPDLMSRQKGAEAGGVGGVVVGGVVIGGGRGGGPRRGGGDEDVLDIAPAFDKDRDLEDAGHRADDADENHYPRQQQQQQQQQDPPKHQKRWSLMSDFQRWRRAAVRGSFGGVSLGIRFRRSGATASGVGGSGSENEKSPGGVGAGANAGANGNNASNGNNGNNGTNAPGGGRLGFLDTNRPASSTVSLPSSGSTARRERALRKGKMRAVSGRRSWSPSFMLDLPVWLGGGGRQSRTQRQSARLSALRAQHMADSGEDDEDTHQRFPTSFAATAEDAEMYAAQISQHAHGYARPTQGQGAAAEHPPSYAASVSLSNRDSVRDSHSHSDPPSFLVPSGPRSVSSNSPNSPVFHGTDMQQRRESDNGNNSMGAGAQDVPVAMVSVPPANVKDAGATTSSSSNAPLALRPLPSIAQYKRNQQQQQQQHIYATTSPEQSSNSGPGPGLHRKIIDPRLIDTSLETTDDNPSIEEPRIMREVLRSLSPRTSRSLPVPPPPRRLPPQELIIGTSSTVKTTQPDDAESPESVTSPTRRLLPLVESGHESRWMDSAPSGGRTVKALPRTPTSDDDDEGELIRVQDSVFLNMPETSPFRVDFETRSTRTSIRPLPPTRSIASDAQSDNSGNSGGGAGVGGVSSDESVNEPAYYTTAAESSSYKHKPARNTFGASESSHAPPSGGSRLSEFVQGTSGSHLPFRLPSHEPQSASASSPVKPSPVGSEGVVSFIDFTSTPEGSLRVPSEKSSSKKKQKRTRKRSLPVPPQVDEPKSRWSNTTVPSIATNPQVEGEAGHGQESSGESQMPTDAAERRLTTDSRALPLTIQVEIPSSSHDLLEPQPLSAVAVSQRSSSIATQSDNLHVHPAAMLENMESPTDSLPLSTSEIRFRHASDSEPDDGSSRLRHSSTGTSDEYMPRPFDPNILVGRVLGMSSPTSSATARPPHSRSPSNLALSSATNSVFPFNSRNDSSNDQLNSSRPGLS